MTDYGVLIGKFSPINKDHIELLKMSFKECNKLIVFIDSSDSSTNIKNPWTYKEKLEMFQIVLNEEFSEFKDRIKIFPLPGFIYNNIAWTEYIQKSVNSIISKNSTIEIIGNSQIENIKFLNWPIIFFSPKATSFESDIAEQIFLSYINSEMNAEWKNFVSKGVEKYINNFMVEGSALTDRAIELIDEYQYVKSYKKAWENSPYPPIFVTVDAVVIQSGHILVIRRKRNPGKGKYALPGGFLEQNEYIKNACIRELSEETHIDVPETILEKSVIDNNVFDYPYRSSRGRTITHAFLFRLNDLNALPKFQADDDAEECIWMSLEELESKKEEFFEDHYYMISYFIDRNYIR